MSQIVNASDRVIYDTLSNKHQFLVVDNRKGIQLDRNPQNLAGIHNKQNSGFLQSVPVTGQEASVEEAVAKVSAQRPDLALAAADVVLIASGTATLQAALWKKPMVISYKVPWLTAQIMKRQGYLPYVGLPNILCGEFVVPELLQDAAKPEDLAREVMHWLNHPEAVQALQKRFEELHRILKRPTGLLVAQAIEQTVHERVR